jgi:hypothetical protein
MLFFKLGLEVFLLHDPHYPQILPSLAYHMQLPSEVVIDHKAALVIRESHQHLCPRNVRILAVILIAHIHYELPDVGLADLRVG